jgi:LPS-assembly lipoprotein
MAMTVTLSNNKLARGLTVLALAATLTACGFKLRGSEGYNLPFHSIYVNIPDSSAFGAELRRNLRGLDNVLVLPSATGAEAQLNILSETQGKAILSLNAQGLVREYLLTYTLTFRVVNAAGVEILAPSSITLHRNLAFSEDVVLAKQGEEALLIRDMQSDAVQQIIRRLAAIKPVE